MDYDNSDSSGTDDDLPPSHRNRIPRGGQFAVSERSAVGSISFSRKHTDMEDQIHYLEQEAYCAVLRAFKAQSDAISWDKESLITELRKELRVSDDEHRELLTKVNSDEIISKIREWRKGGGHQVARHSASQPVYDLLPSPLSASRKKQKTSQSHGQPSPGLSAMKSMQYPSTGPTLSRQVSRSSSGALVGSQPAEAPTFHPYIGRKVWTRWPADNNFYEAVIYQYNPTNDTHALVYDIQTANETWEWVDLKDISPEDIRWESEDAGLSHRGGHGGGRRGRKPSNHRGVIPGAGRGRGEIKAPSKKEIHPSQNGIGKVSDDLELLNTDTLVKEVERVFNANDPDPFELEKARKMLKDHEQALVDAIARLAYASDGESGNGYMCT